jgi:hypothetical protein
MKKLKNVLLPAVIILIGAGAAFATNGAKSSIDATQPGYYFNSSTNRCVETAAQCSTSGSRACTWTDSQGTHNLSTKISDTMCGDPLYRP